MLDELQRQTAGKDLNYGQRQSLETLIAARDDVLSRYPDPQGILNMKAKHDQSLRTLERETVRARAAAIAEHIDTQPGWVTLVGTRPTGRQLRETWDAVVEDLAGRYVDKCAQIAVERERAQDLVGDRITRARAEAQARFEALRTDPDNRDLLKASLDAQRTADQIELDSAPRWLTGTLGERPADHRLAEQWDRLGHSMIRLRDRNGITDQIDNGLRHADGNLKHAISRFRRTVGLDPPQRGADIGHGYGIGD
ncbi:MAG TPA: hypothetical protein VMF07_02955 [Solirubrobacteraceae bacterium]|nr:hypothetical protein [Solirubrobacteraceae bacterium]